MRRLYAWAYVTALRIDWGGVTSWIVIIGLALCYLMR